MRRGGHILVLLALCAITAWIALSLTGCADIGTAFKPSHAGTGYSWWQTFTLVLVGIGLALVTDGVWTVLGAIGVGVGGSALASMPMDKRPFEVHGTSGPIAGAPENPAPAGMAWWWWLVIALVVWVAIKLMSSRYRTNIIDALKHALGALWNLLQLKVPFAVKSARSAVGSVAKASGMKHSRDAATGDKA